MTCSLYLDYQEIRKTALAGFSRIQVQLAGIHISHDFFASFIFLRQSEEDRKAKAEIKLLWTIFLQTPTFLLIRVYVFSTLRLTDIFKKKKPSVNRLICAVSLEGVGGMNWETRIDIYTLLWSVHYREAPVLWPPDVKKWLTGKDPDAGKDWRQEEKGPTEWDGWMASLTWRTWAWACSRTWWWTGKPGML